MMWSPKKLCHNNRLLKFTWHWSGMQSLFQNTHSRFFLILLTMGSFSLGMTEYSMIGLSNEIAADLKLTNHQTSQVMSAYAMGVLIGAPLLAVLGSKLNRHTLMAYLLLWCACGNLFISFAHSYEQLRWLRTLNGFPHGLYFSTAALLIYDVFPKNKRANYIGVMFSGIGLALVVAVPFNTWVGEMQGWRYMYRFMALIDLLILVLLHNLSPALPLQHQNSITQGLRAFKNLKVWWVLLLGATVISGKVGVLTYAEHIVMEITHLHGSLLPVIIMCVGLGMTTGSLLGGKLASLNVQKTLFGAICWIMMVMVLVRLLAPNVHTVYLAFYFLGTITVFIPALQVLIIDYTQPYATLPSAAYHSALNCGNAAGPLLSSVLIGAGYGYLSSTWVGLVLAVCAAVIYVLGRTYLRPV